MPRRLNYIVVKFFKYVRLHAVRIPNRIPAIYQIASFLRSFFFTHSLSPSHTLSLSLSHRQIKHDTERDSMRILLNQVNAFQVNGLTFYFQVSKYR